MPSLRPSEVAFRREENDVSGLDLQSLGKLLEKL
jgi:hypothetical protein